MSVKSDKSSVTWHEIINTSDSAAMPFVDLYREYADAVRERVLDGDGDARDAERDVDREIERDLVQFQWVPRVNISAKTGRHMERLVPALETALNSWDTRVPTGRLNAFLGEVVASHPHPVRGGKQPRILFATQASTRPPRFVVFASGFLEAGYRRFLERRLREEFGFPGTPVMVAIRVKERDKENG